MKNLLIGVLIILSACSKPSPTANRNPAESYIGTYNRTVGDTAYVSIIDDATIKIKWCPLNLPDIYKITFDSVKILPDLTFSVNQRINYVNGNTALGTGYFSGNTIYFHFNIGTTGVLDFLGIKH